jgi:hypothetical protein
MTKGMIDENTKQSNEQRYYDALYKIARKYEKSEKLAHFEEDSDDGYGLSGAETLEYAYDNIQAEAERAIHGKRRPKE